MKFTLFKADFFGGAVLRLLEADDFLFQLCQDEVAILRGNDGGRRCFRDPFFRFEKQTQGI